MAKDAQKDLAKSAAMKASWQRRKQGSTNGLSVSVNGLTIQGQDTEHNRAVIGQVVSNVLGIKAK